MSNSWDKKESEDRGKKFLKEYEELCTKHGYELMAAPQYIPSGTRGFNTTAVLVPIDLKNRPVPSPLSDDKPIK